MFRLCSLLLALVLAAPAAAQTLSGPIRVIDADTIDIGASATIRLLAIDAAEDAQTCRGGARELACGALATAAARALYEGRRAVCATEGRDRYGRLLATCEVAGRDIGADLVDRGLARTYRDDLTYAEEEKAAILFGRGLWAYEMQDPAEWRAGQRASPVAETAPGSCEIKGNISGSGHIYHVPGSRSYDATRIDPAKGERWFCSEAEARAAGWRAPRG
ncbi:thermonuclease family protein [Jannaschia formosa]|uniref:thermonuclease family protein n=1 Tax=Jannaschia formosa TaxID=2259592 RepID=UPI000E1BF459|nr:thermonuclease family protein [Jannaschia formosa]TFL16693.1 thermonuclease family protein [Jannaschia formosa]